MVDPSLCPIPPGFEVIGNFSDEFDDFKDTTGYDNGGWGGPNAGFSNRWKNSNIRSANIVCGFQFKIGPDPGWRWNSKGRLGEVKGGDVNLFFPRSSKSTKDVIGDFFDRDRGNYFVALKWHNEKQDIKTDDGLVVEASLNKEFPHGTYGGKNFFLEEGNFFRSQPNPRPSLPQIRDGQWHSFLGVIFNDWYRRKTFGGSGFFPTIGLWYSQIATHKFEDFTFLGMGIDNYNMPPREPLLFGIEDSNKTIGDSLLAEHPLQIRIDDVPTEQVEITNVYAANVIFHGAIPPPNPVNCIPEAKAVSDAQATIDKLLEQAKEARKKIIKPGQGFGDMASNPRLQILDDIINNGLPNAKSELGTAKFNYGECANIGFRRRPRTVIPAFFSKVEGKTISDAQVKFDAAKKISRDSGQTAWRPST